ncbi:hypothetical protein QN277_005025 [Acacia crassicarpa]|uniref:Homeobox domain-containing protein n=1 Tax=Acacia crassicarpa TaxID=499986 RepID=A0AAE1JVY6_9FABA|nr:hypothetical protein QN277_005025 [Acacia crassicarpa]
MATYLPNSYSETPITSSNITLYMNTGSYPEAFSGNSQEQNGCFVIPPMSLSQSAPEQQEILANLGGLQTGDYDFSAWRQGRNEMLVTNPMDGHNMQSQGLSLSLGTQTPTGIQVSPFHDQSSNPSFDSFLGQNPSISGHKSSSSRHECMRPSEILPPDLPEASQVLNRGDYSMHGGMPSVSRTIPNSKYLKAAQELLDEVVDIQKAIKQSPSTREKKTSKENDGRLENESAPADREPNPRDFDGNASCEISNAERQDLQNKLTKLLSMLDEVHSRYKQYYHQMQIVVSSFDVIAGRGAAKPYTALALQTISRHFRCLHDAITGQISATQKSLGEQDSAGNNKGVGISRLRYVDQQIRQQRALQQLGVMHHAWRPQRGLPENSVSILRAWLFEHFLHPYPKDSEKAMLARQTGLTRSQVSNWFINARVRLWKPMIEEMYKEEIENVDLHSSSSTEEASKVSKSDVKISDDGCDDLQQSQSSLADKNSKDSRSDKQTEEQQRLSFDDRSVFQDDTVVQTNEGITGFVAVAPACQMSELGRFQPGNGVSLTLGLQHCEVGNYMSGESRHSFVVMREDGTIGAQTSELDYVAAGNQHQRFTSPH